MVIIVNVGAGTGEKADLSERIATWLAAKGHSATVHLAHSGQQVMALARDAVAAGEKLLVAGGGDGTVNAVASVLVGTDTVLGVLPLGTLNHFAGDLGIPKDLEGALQTLFDGFEQRIDVGDVNGRIFLNNSSLGLYPDIVVYRLWQQRRGFAKWPAFALAVLWALRRLPLLDVRLATAHGQEVQRTPFVFFGNNRYVTEGFRSGSRERLDAGLLSMYTTHAPHRWGLFRLALGVIVPRFRDKQVLEVACLQEAWISMRRRRLRVATDGEVTTMPLRCITA